ncbi:hypothetical protein QBC47DRAFT_441366 [Echria macrotheca]|uniref:Uncharacterized protein n=1 Tax=Echria macrotheca TaxID=438768 RepID=A0AAJ0BHW6_9PEZI|nr:hypothetical protein QBC47DRAFT_441366 [Echria macrotheca]
MAPTRQTHGHGSDTTHTSPPHIDLPRTPHAYLQRHEHHPPQTQTQTQTLPAHEKIMRRDLHEGNTPRIAAIVVGSLLGLVIACAAAWVLWRRRVYYLEKKCSGGGSSSATTDPSPECGPECRGGGGSGGGISANGCDDSGGDGPGSCGTDSSRSGYLCVCGGGGCICGGGGGARCSRNDGYTHTHAENGGLLADGALLTPTYTMPVSPALFSPARSEVGLLTGRVHVLDGTVPDFGDATRTTTGQQRPDEPPPPYRA